MARKRVCIIGAGSSGLAAIGQCLEFGLEVVAFETRAKCGGAWQFDEDAGACSVSFEEDGTVVVKGSKDATSMYSSLRTNVPTTLMAYRGLPFPPSTPLYPDPATVATYLEQAATEVSQHIRFQTKVTGLRYTVPEDGGEQRKWHVEATEAAGEMTEEQFDAVIVANGHYTLPYVPPIRGLQHWPGTIRHARWYRGAEGFTNKNVLVVGNAASGYDICREIATLRWEQEEDPGRENDNHFIAQSIRSAPMQVPPFDAPDAPEYGKLVQLFGEISHVEETGRVHFVDGKVLNNVDVIMFATGYFFSFPFADTSQKPFVDHPLIQSPYEKLGGGFRIRNLDERQLFYLPDPTLSFLAIHFYIVPFPFAQVESRLIAAFYAGKLPLSFSPMITEDDHDTKDPHTMGFPAEHDYTDRLLEEMGEGRDDYSLWSRIPAANRDLRMGAKGLRKAVLGY